MDKNNKESPENEQILNESISTSSSINISNGPKDSSLFIPLQEEAKPKKLAFMEVLSRLSPGKTLRIALDDILEGKTGALIVVDCPELKDMIDGGFKINCAFSNQKVAELAKMDGAIVLSEDLKKILFANVLLVPDAKIPTNETGTRHKAAERTAKQTGTIVVAVSERRSKISLFYEDKKYILEDSENLLRRATETLNILEKQREIFEDILKNLNVLETTRLVSIGDVCSVLQRIEVIIKMVETMKRYLTELGNQGVIIRMRVREMFKGIEVLEDLILQDYSNKPQNLKKMLSELSFEGVIDMESLSRMLFENSPDTQIMPRGYRLLSKLNLTEREIKSLIDTFGNLSAISEANEEEINKILKAKTGSFKKEFENLREQILLGKKI